MLESCKKDLHPFFKRGAILFLFLFLINCVRADPTVTIGNYVSDNKVVVLGDTSLHCRLTGCTMQGDINMDNYSIYNANYINVTYINMTTVYGDIYGDIYGFWNGSIDYYTKTEIDQNFTDFAAGITDTYVNATCPAGEVFESINGTVYGCVALTSYDDTWINTTTNASILYMIQNLTTNGTPAEYDGGFANSVYLASQLIDGGTA